MKKKVKSIKIFRETLAHLGENIKICIQFTANLGEKLTTKKKKHAKDYSWKTIPCNDDSRSLPVCRRNAGSDD